MILTVQNIYQEIESENFIYESKFTSTELRKCNNLGNIISEAASISFDKPKKIAISPIRNLNSPYPLKKSPAELRWSSDEIWESGFCLIKLRLFASIFCDVCLPPLKFFRRIL